MGNRGDGGWGARVPGVNEDGGGVFEAGPFGGSGASDFKVGESGEGAFHGGVGGEGSGAGDILSRKTGASCGGFKNGKGKGFEGGLAEEARIVMGLGCRLEAGRGCGRVIPWKYEKE